MADKDAIDKALAGLRTGREAIEEAILTLERLQRGGGTPRTARDASANATDSGDTDSGSTKGATAGA